MIISLIRNSVMMAVVDLIDKHFGDVTALSVKLSFFSVILSMSYYFINENDFFQIYCNRSFFLCGVICFSCSYLIVFLGEQIAFFGLLCKSNLPYKKSASS